METIKISGEAFDAFEKEAKIKYLDDMRDKLGDSSTQIQIGDNICSDRESLQYWQIEKGYIK